MRRRNLSVLQLIILQVHLESASLLISILLLTSMRTINVRHGKILVKFEV